MTMHAVRCKRTGEMLAVKLDGGTCVCPTADECPMAAKPEPVERKDCTVGLTGTTGTGAAYGS